MKREYIVIFTFLVLISFTFADNINIPFTDTGIINQFACTNASYGNFFSNCPIDTNYPRQYIFNDYTPSITNYIQTSGGVLNISSINPVVSHTGYMFIFEDNLVFNNDSRISFEYKVSSNAWTGSFTFKNFEINCIYSNLIDDYSPSNRNIEARFCGTGTTTTTADYLSKNNTGTSLSSTAWATFNLSFLGSDTLSNLPNAPKQNTKYFILHLFNPTASNEEILIRNMKIENADSLNNSLPTGDITMLNISTCLDEQLQNKEVFYNVSATDLEGDTLYYSTFLGKIFRKSLVYNQDFIKQVGNDVRLDYSFFDDGTLVSNYSSPSTDSENWLWRAGNYPNIFSYTLQTTLFNDFTEVRGSLQVPNDINEFWLNFKPLIYDTETYLRYRFTDKEQYFITFIENTNNKKLMNISYNYTDYGNLSISIEGVERKNIEISEGELVYFTVLTNTTSNLINVTVGIDSDTEEAWTEGKSISFNEFQFIAFENTDLTSPVRSEWGIQDIIVEQSGFETISGFTTTKPTSLTVNITGDYTLEVYVSDSIHQPTTYTTLTEKFYIGKCTYTTTQEEIIGQDKKDAIGSVKTGIFNICSSLNVPYTALPYGIDVSFCTIMNFLYFIVCMVMAIIVYVIFRDLVGALFTLSFCMMFGNFILTFSSTTVVIIGIIFATTLISMLIRVMIPIGRD